MKRSDWAAISLGAAAVVGGLAAIPPGPTRFPSVVVALVLLAVAVGIGAWSGLSRASGCVIESPAEGSDVLVDRVVRVAGSISRMGEDRLWVFVEGLIEGKRVWIFGGEALTDSKRFSFPYVPTAGETGTDVTLTVVRAGRQADLHLRGIERGADTRRRVNNAPLGGCVPLGSVTVHVVDRERQQPGLL